jgi:hypothetical protein
VIEEARQLTHLDQSTVQGSDRSEIIEYVHENVEPYSLAKEFERNTSTPDPQFPHLQLAYRFPFV